MNRKIIQLLTIVSLFTTYFVYLNWNKITTNAVERNFDVRDDRTIRNFDVRDDNTTQASARDGKNRILLISPLGRAGSTWIGNMLSEIDENTYYVDEPLSIYGKYYEDHTKASSREVIREILSCNLPKWMVKSHSKFPRTMRNFKRKCGEDCKTLDDFNNRCKSATTFVIKEIKTVLKTTKDFLSMPSMKGLKVIYLVRDPRAQFFSRDITFQNEIRLSDIESYCEKLNDGVDTFRELAALFPGQLYFLRYEDMCIKPEEEIEKLWRFLNLANVRTEKPRSLQKYINDHNEQIANKKYGLFRSGASEWNSWRNEMSDTDFDFVAVEKECKKAMKYSGYLRLNKTKNLDDMDLDTLGDKNCFYLNC